MYIVIGQDTRIEPVLEQKAYGPFENFEDANAFAEKKTISEGTHVSYNGFTVWRSYSYSVLELRSE